MIDTKKISSSSTGYLIKYFGLILLFFVLAVVLMRPNVNASANQRDAHVCEINTRIILLNQRLSEISFKASQASVDLIKIKIHITELKQEAKRLKWDSLR